MLNFIMITNRSRRREAGRGGKILRLVTTGKMATLLQVGLVTNHVVEAHRRP